MEKKIVSKGVFAAKMTFSAITEFVSRQNADFSLSRQIRSFFFAQNEFSASVAKKNRLERRFDKISFAMADFFILRLQPEALPAFHLLQSVIHQCQRDFGVILSRFDQNFMRNRQKFGIFRQNFG